MVLTHQAVLRKSLPSATIDPQAGVGGATPAPRKLRIDSSRITTLTCNVPTTITVLSTPGKRWVNKIRRVEAPATRAIAT